MGGMSPIHWVILAVVVLVVFGGGGKISGMMGDFAKGIKSFKKNMADDESMASSSASTPESPSHLSAPTGGVHTQSHETTQTRV
ncbi:twin-arginine translocase TatA/TatE family subunit [Neokomagataea thailandica]|uniref:Sec-independent protein translocase protein TatA n=1 Tax=Neokomagataea tanensis NBRC 106556 TaxID=1223519 RepID=A0ABQ0QGV6_9PROT|nr:MULTISPECIES: twin-arginine translocase TatA/TatE family subunit [Neokomagataea]GBR44371.1 Sec-independent protein translocase protein TatA [Neokomagataea tanensis NBRC 106556]